MKKALVFGLWLVFLGTSLGAAPKNKNRSGCFHSPQEYQKAFRDSQALERQNYVIDFWKIKRVEDQKTLEIFAQTGGLVGIAPQNSRYLIDPAFPERLRFLRLFARWLLEDFAEDFYRGTQAKKAHTSVNRRTGKVKTIIRGKIKRIKITSLTRTRDYQGVLIKRLPNGQAASMDPDNPRQSSHLAGTTFDVSTKGWSRAELCWALDYLYDLQTVELMGHVIWEPRNRVLHIMAFPVPTVSDEIARRPN